MLTVSGEARVLKGWLLFFFSSQMVLFLSSLVKVKSPFSWCNHYDILQSVLWKEAPSFPLHLPSSPIWKRDPCSYDGCLPPSLLVTAASDSTQHRRWYYKLQMPNGLPFGVGGKDVHPFKYMHFLTCTHREVNAVCIECRRETILWRAFTWWFSYFWAHDGHFRIVLWAWLCS